MYKYCYLLIITIAIIIIILNCNDISWIRVNNKTNKSHKQTMLNLIETAMILTQTATCSRRSSSVVELQSKRQNTSTANKCRSESTRKSAEDERPDTFQHMHEMHKNVSRYVFLIL